MSLIEERHLRVDAVIQNVEPVCQFVETMATDAGMSEALVYRCYLSMEEIITNVIEHGYGHQGTGCSVDVVCRLYPGRLAITVMDDATPFNPLSREDPDPAAPLMERENGGWGIYFVKKFMDAVSYDYKENRNQLTIEKQFTPG